jgi:hypothetical protein
VRVSRAPRAEGRLSACQKSPATARAPSPTPPPSPPVHPSLPPGERGDLYLAVTLPAWQWAALGPALEALGGTRVRNNHSGDVLSSHPSIIRYGMSEVLRRPLPWL